MLSGWKYELPRLVGARSFQIETLSAPSGPNWRR